MMNHQQQRRTVGAPRSAGFVLLTVLVAVGVISGLVAAFGRHVIVEGRSGMSALPMLEAREACHSGVRFARQALVSGMPGTSQTIPSGSGSATYSVIALPLGHQGLLVESVGDDGFGARRLLELGVKAAPSSVPVSPATLPTLDAATVAALQADQSLTVYEYTRSTTLQGVELSGLLVVHPGVDLVLDDVVVTGAIVSSSVMDQVDFHDYDAATAPQIIIAGNVRIDSHPSLPGVAVLMPDGVLSSAAGDVRVQIHGDIVAHDVQLTHAGVLGGNVSAVNLELADASVLDRLGSGRKDVDWSGDLQLGGVTEPVFLATVPPASSTEALASIINYWSND